MLSETFKLESYKVYVDISIIISTSDKPVSREIVEFYPSRSVLSDNFLSNTYVSVYNMSKWQRKLQLNSIPELIERLMYIKTNGFYSLNRKKQQTWSNKEVNMSMHSSSHSHFNLLQANTV